MGKEKSQPVETLNVLIAGHIDHGKTTLLHKLSGRWTDTHSEELKRGITIKLGYADITLYKDGNSYNREKKGTPFRTISFIDAPGHEMLMATMLSGAAIVDAAILVVAANEGIKPQTREHLIALQAKKIENIVIVQNKIDLVNQERAQKNYEEIKALIKGTYAENSPIIPVSAQQEVNIDKIFQALAEIALPARETEGDPLFIVARSFDINKPGTKPEGLHGTVLGGTLKRGTLKVGDEIEIKPGVAVKEANQLVFKPLTTKVLKLFRGSTSVDEITPGGSMSIETELDMTLGKSDALSGCSVSTKGKLPETTLTLKVKYTLFKEVLGSLQKASVDSIKASETLMVSINTSVTVGTVKRVTPTDIEISLRIPTIAFKGENVGLARNMNNHWRLIGHGTIL